ncbi:MAG: hypothetical protein NTZ86_08130 [Legionellales bacterium]|nr:hypothetical protein [Legionellales bacterium]
MSVHKHIPTNQMHVIDTGYQYKDRVAAVHWGEGQDLRKTLRSRRI